MSIGIRLIPSYNSTSAMDELARQKEKSSRDGSDPPTTSNRSKRRATRACDRCKYKKMRCTGKLPCLNCTNADVPFECSYTAKYTRGKAPQIQVATYRETSVTRPASKNEVPFGIRRSSSDNVSETLSTGSTNSPFNDESSAQHHETSTFAPFAALYRSPPRIMIGSVQEKLQNPVYAFGDPPLLDVDLSFFVLPPLKDARQLIDKFFESVTPNIKFFHEPTIKQWLLDLFQSFSRGTHTDDVRTAIVLFMLATSLRSDETSNGSDNSHVSFRYYRAAEDLLQKEKGPVRLESIQARLLQCFYLLTLSRFNHAWSVFGSVVSQIFVMGLHRQSKAHSAAKKDLVYAECCKRTFWSAYMLDKFLSLSLNRPQYLRDDSIDQELPLLVNDENLSQSSCLISVNKLQCTMTLSIYQKEQAAILGAILDDLYGVKIQTLEERLQLTKKHHTSIKLLAHSYSAFLEQDMIGKHSPFRDQLSRAKLWRPFSTVILFRPFLLAYDGGEDELPDVIESNCEINVSLCLEAALEITRAINSEFLINRISHDFWFTHFCGYTAVVALYVYIIKQQKRENSSWIGYLKAAETCQNQIKVRIEKDSFFERCNEVLEELLTEITSDITSRTRQEERRGSIREQEATTGSRSRTLHYSDQFNMTTTDERARRQLPEVTYGDDWQSIDFDQTAPGGGILGSMDWIQANRPSSMLEKIEQLGFLGLTAT